MRRRVRARPASPVVAVVAVVALAAMTTYSLMLAWMLA